MLEKSWINLVIFLLIAIFALAGLNLALKKPKRPIPSKQLISIWSKKWLGHQYPGRALITIKIEGIHPYLGYAIPKRNTKAQ